MNPLLKLTVNEDGEIWLFVEPRNKKKPQAGFNLASARNLNVTTLALLAAINEQGAPNLTLNELQQLASRTLPAPGVNHWFEPPAARPGDANAVTQELHRLFCMRIDLLHAMMGVCGEAGEKVDPIKKSMFYGKPLDVENIREEAGDLLWYIAGPLCRALGCTLEDLARANVAKLQKRYPEKYTDQAAIERADKQ